MRLPPETIAAIDANRGDKDRTHFIIEMVAKIAINVDGKEVDRCEGPYDGPCYYGTSDRR